MDKFIQDCHNKIATINRAILEHQKRCSHKHVKLNPFRTGEFDTEFVYGITCQSCGKYWVHDQEAFNQKLRNKEHYE